MTMDVQIEKNAGENVQWRSTSELPETDIPRDPVKVSDAAEAVIPNG